EIIAGVHVAVPQNSVLIVAEETRERMVDLAAAVLVDEELQGASEVNVVGGLHRSLLLSPKVDPNPSAFALQAQSGCSRIRHSARGTPNSFGRHSSPRLFDLLRRVTLTHPAHGLGE